ncbi:MAG: OsmC family peroxiredoxin [Candidatus Dormibacteria bacterium]
MAVRTAHVAWNGTLEQGSGQVELTSSKLATYEVSFPRRTADDAEGVTSPEELIAAAHAACYAMQLSAMVAKEGATPGSLDVTAAVSLGPDPAGGLAITGIRLTVIGKLDGLNDVDFERVAQAAKAGCPVSKALTGTTITLDASLA